MPSRMDQVADTQGIELARLAGLYEFPDFVKQADFSQVMSPDVRAITTYADPVRKQFPCDSAASTWMSALFFQEKRAEFHPKDQSHIQRRLDEYVRYWRVKSAVDQMRERWTEIHKTAEAKLPDSAYAYVWSGTNGVKERHLPIRNRMEVKVAAEYLLAHRDKIPFSDRHVIATKILEKVAAYGAGLGTALMEFTERQAGRGVCDPAEVISMIEKRAMLVKQPELQGHFRKMAATIRTAPQQYLQPDMLIKLAQTMDTLDRTLGLVGKYTDIVQRPEDVIFKSTFVKAASEMAAHVATTSGRVYEKQAFKRLTVKDVTELFGTDFADRVKSAGGLDIDPEKMAEEVSTLPRPDAELLDGLLGEVGIAPSLLKAGAAKSFMEQQAAKWAAAYQPVG